MRAPPRLIEIATACAAAFDVRLESMFHVGPKWGSGNPSRTVVLARYSFVLVAERHTLKSKVEIAQFLGASSSGAIVRDARRRVIAESERDPLFREVFERLLRLFDPRLPEPEPPGGMIGGDGDSTEEERGRPGLAKCRGPVS